MKKEVYKNIQLRVSPEFHTILKMYCVHRGVSLQEYVLGMITTECESLGLVKKIV